MMYEQHFHTQVQTSFCFCRLVFLNAFAGLLGLLHPGKQTAVHGMEVYSVGRGFVSQCTHNTRQAAMNWPYYLPTASSTWA